jgi:hypothetical protein
MAAETAPEDYLREQVVNFVGYSVARQLKWMTAMQHDAAWVRERYAGLESYLHRLFRAGLHPEEVLDCFRSQIPGGRELLGSIEPYIAPWWWHPMAPSPHLWGRTAPSPLSRVTIPFVADWDSGVTTLGDKLYLALATPSYFQHGNDPTPSIVAALIIVGDGVSGAYGERYSASIRAAVSWLATNVAQLPLPDAAEAALADFAWGRLRGRFSA